MGIGKRIQALREEKDISQKELADKIGLNYSVMNRIESGERPARDEEVKRIAQALQVSTDYLLDMSDVKNPNKIITIAAHHEGDDYTEEELNEIEAFKEWVKARKMNK